MILADIDETFSARQTAWRSEVDSNPQYNSMAVKVDVCVAYAEALLRREFKLGTTVSQWQNQCGSVRSKRGTGGDAKAESCESGSTLRGSGVSG